MNNVNIEKVAGAALAFGIMGITTQAFAVDSPYKGDIVLNEYNAVGPEETLEDCPNEGDIFFGCDPGNGDNWVEFLIMDNIDSIQGWKVSWKNSDTGGHANNGSFVFSNSSVWTNLKAGTLITIHYNGDPSYTTSYTGAPCSDSNWWIDAAALDTNLIVDADLFYNTTSLGDGFKSDNDNYQVKIEDAASPRKEVLAWVGEGVSGISGVGEDEVCKLEQSPTYGSPINYGNYNDGDCSSFGAPNCWSSGASVQSLNSLCNASCSRLTGC